MTARRAGAIALSLALALHVAGLAAPATAGPWRRTARFLARQAIRFVEARQAIDGARDLRDRLRPLPAPPAWPSVVAAGSSTAPQRPRETPEPRPRGPQQ